MSTGSLQNLSSSTYHQGKLAISHQVHQSYQRPISHQILISLPHTAPMQSCLTSLIHNFNDTHKCHLPFVHSRYNPLIPSHLSHVLCKLVRIIVCLLYTKIALHPITPYRDHNHPISVTCGWGWVQRAHNN